ncbi:UNVERIFIED_CONTAM: Pentatricopeptide repeat-containing protein [Sesamum calycinum]|uniref:Pentatricopeptide repeat-containing protein n=1 Tax=Sesamum calycinum TaxID=2727403 RepID=A0AAW2JVU6_9LAMI
MFVQFSDSQLFTHIEFNKTGITYCGAFCNSTCQEIQRSNQTKSKQKNQVLECLGHGHMSKKNGLERAPGGRVERKYSFLAVLELKVEALMAEEQLGWERALEIFEWFKMKRCYEVNVIHYNIMFKILGKARQWCEVERLWGEMWKRGIKPINSTYGTLIDVYCKGGFRDLAIKWLELMNKSGMEPDEVTTGIVVQMYKKGRDFKRAEEFFKKWSNSMVDERGSAIVWSEAHVSGDFSKCL